MTDFTQLGLSPTTLQAVIDTGYTTATPIQAQAIPVALAGRDVLGIAQTGTGKTAAFTLPLIERLASGRAKARMPRALVLAPTRELADQVAESFAKYAKGTKLNWVLLIGGVSMGDQVAALNKGVDVLIATPGRLLDLFDRGKMMLNGVEIMVVDEADRMLDMGFIPDIEKIFKLTPPKRQTLFFSATMPPEITRLTTQFLKDPTRIEASRPAMTAETITQYLVRIPGSDPKLKREALRALVGRDDVKNGIVFCNRKSEVNVVAKSLKQHGFDASPIHGDLDQSLRTKTLADFRSGALKILVASDVAARGLDIPDVSHVFNYDVAHNADDYVHRIGRTGRAGKTGQTFMIVTPSDDRSLDKVLKLIKMTPEELTLDLSSGGKARPAKTESAKAADEGAAVEKPTRSRRQASPAVAEETSGEAPARRSRSRRKPLSETAEVETETAPVEVRPVDQPIEAPKPEASDAEPRKRSRSRGGRGRKSDGAPEARSDTNARKDNDARKDSAPIKASDSSAFGNDGVPAFLRRPI
ncbi:MULTISPECIES: DEAD/DEAH box helicase [unclassified Brevundimonas]|jgi:superfamily II DNA/RNA helicase|uniref:DEAD/DEAH box helicase n=1 Tax=unclassified Brevundimonas TaxID=2622653 RepID=UPI000C525A02|nr:MULTISPECIES: DEAD/DEAH box helicase [unclassified Brevundimonas]MAL87515.1 RNA helicase [Brevundimonas sp.]HAV50207.1 RNA helicase [Brevundimonas sp.]|tara:strand:- start:4036 stop:5619 length:1584 start_codon:yes stop_codon:yes gene_type:complete